jgi:hypothetical protein
VVKAAFSASFGPFSLVIFILDMVFSIAGHFQALPEYF